MIQSLNVPIKNHKSQSLESQHVELQKRGRFPLVHSSRAGEAQPGPLWRVQRLAPLTFLNMTSEMTADAVKSAAMIIIMIPTGMFLLRPVRDEIQPLRDSRHVVMQTSQCNSQNNKRERTMKPGKVSIVTGDDFTGPPRRQLVL